MHACICHYAEIYNNIYIFCLERNKTFIKQLYSKMNVIPVVIPQKEHNKHKLPYAPPLTYIKKFLPSLKDYKLIKTSNSFLENGKISDEWNKSNHIIWFKKFYFLANVPYSIRQKYRNINRNHKRELELYNKVINIYGEKYIFVHDHRNIHYKHTRNIFLNEKMILNENYPIFHPSINFYNNKNHKYYNLWNADFITDNILDLCMVIEKSYKINIIDSAFLHLCSYLDLSNVTEKKILNHNALPSSLTILDPSYIDWIKY